MFVVQVYYPYCSIVPWKISMKFKTLLFYVTKDATMCKFNMIMKGDIFDR